MLARALFLSLSLGASLVPALGPMRHRDMVEPVRLLSVCVSSDGGPERCASRLVLLFILSTVRGGSSTSRMAVATAGSSLFSSLTPSTSAMHSFGAWAASHWPSSDCCLETERWSRCWLPLVWQCMLELTLVLLSSGLL